MDLKLTLEHSKIVTQNFRGVSDNPQSHTRPEDQDGCDPTRRRSPRKKCIENTATELAEPR